MNTTIAKQEENKKLPQLIKGSSTYKLIVPEKVEEKIRYLLRKFPHTEWSGVLFVKHTGSFENTDLVITCEDLYPMDLGSAGWTEFKMSEDVAAYMAENIELFDCDTALVHSHHTLGAFLSGQDMKMVQQEGNDTNCFVSLVVDTPGNYVAIVTRKVQRKEKITRTSLGESYEFFGEGSKELTKENFSTVENVVDNSYIEYFNLEVERHEVQNNLSYLDTRFDEIEQKKAKKSNQRFIPKVPKNEYTEGSFFDWLHKEANPDIENPFKESLDNKVLELVPTDEKKLNTVSGEWKPDPKKIHRAVCQIITCDLIINPDKFDLKQWVYRYMSKVYEKIFTKESHEYINGNAFNEWKDYIIPFLLDYFDVSDAPDELLEDWDFLMSEIATAMWNEINQYSDANAYIDEYKKALESYII